MKKAEINKVIIEKIQELVDEAYQEANAHKDHMWVFKDSIEVEMPVLSLVYWAFLNGLEDVCKEHGLSYSIDRVNDKIIVIIRSKGGREDKRGD